MRLRLPLARFPVLAGLTGIGFVGCHFATEADGVVPVERVTRPAPPALSEFEVPDGLQVSLWAESPLCFNPTAIDVDERGRVWVAEGVNYRKWEGRNPGRVHPEGDRIVVLEDTDGDGVCDASSVFVQDPELVSPLGLAVFGNRVFVSNSPDVFVYTDDDGDGRADRRETFLTGFGGRDHDHGAHSFVPGPDGKLYMALGNAGPHVVTDADGRTLRAGSLYSGGGPAPAENRPGLVSDDGRVWTGGLVLRCDPDGGGLEVFAHNFRNDYEVALDAFGNVFTSDNDDDGNASCRTTWVLEGGNYGYCSADGTRSWYADRRPGQATPTAHWHQDDPGVAPAGTIHGAGGPTGVSFYEGELLAAWIGDCVLDADAGAGVVYRHAPRADGAGVELVGSRLLAVRDDAASDARPDCFRPSDVAVAPDGSVFVADWYDPGVGGHLARDAEAYGRILRITPRGVNPEPAAVDLETSAGLRAALHSPAASVRHLAWEQLAALGAESEAVLRPLLAASDTRLRARALWLLARAGRSARAHVFHALGDPSDEIRTTAFRALRSACEGSEHSGAAFELGELIELAGHLAADPSAAVRREVAVWLRRLAGPEVLPMLVQLARGYDGRDRTYLEALGLAAEGQESELFDALAAELGDVSTAWTSAFEGLAWRLHPEAAVPGFLARAMDDALGADARRRAVDALAFAPGRAAAESMLTLALGGPEDVRELAEFWVRHRDDNDWAGFDLLEQVPWPAQEQAEPLFDSGIVIDGLVDIDVDLVGARHLWLLVDGGGNGIACDWADWIDPRIHGDFGERGLGELPWLAAEAGWGEVHVDANAVGEPLAIEGVFYERGIGTHANSELILELPPGTTRFTARAGIDDGGKSQPGAPSSVRFEVWADRVQDRAPVLAARALLTGEAGSSALQREAARLLAGDAEGALVLVRLAGEGKLDAELETVVAEAIFQNPDMGVRALASEYFTRPGGGPVLAPVAELVRREGDASAGREVFFGETAQCATCHVVDGRGGTVGPELSRIGAKLGRLALFDAILNPSAGIAAGYETWIFETDEGRMLSGFLLADGERVVVKDTQGKRHVLARDEIVERWRQELSTMPQGVTLGLTEQQLVDLVAFLAGTGAR